MDEEYYDFGYGDFDLGGINDLDLSSIAELGIGDFDLSGLADIDLSSLEGLDLDSIAELGIGDFDLSGMESANLDAPVSRSLGSGTGEDDLDRLIDSMGSQSREGLEDIEFGDARVLADMGDFDRLNTYGMTPEQLQNRDELMKLGGQEMQVTPENQASFDTNLKDIMENRDGFTSQWQKVGMFGDRVMVMDDGTGIKLNTITGQQDKLTAPQVSSMIRKGDLNTYKSGYNTATGGDKFAPGGGTSVVLKDGSKGTLLPGGKVIDDKGTVIGDSKDVKGKVVNDGTGKTTTKSEDKGSDMMKYIMMLMALAAMRDKGESSSRAVIPNLSASRGTTPYAETQKAPGYRPGQGGVQYFGPTVYRASGGGISSLDAAGGRLLRGPGDGVSDDIVAQIGDSQPARLADGEYVLDARTVSEVGNGSTEAGAEKIAQMVERIHDERRNAKRGEPSRADRQLLA